MTGFAMPNVVAKEAGRDRIVVDGVDVTHFRGFTTPFPRFLLTEPFAYGSTAIQFPQVDAAHETLGTGDLAWARPNAPVLIQRVMPDTSVVTDYVGVVVSTEPTGRILNLSIGGQFAGPASNRYVTPRPFRYTNDVGHWAELACQTLNLHLSPFGGPATGIKVQQTPDQSLLSWAQYVCTMSQNNSGVQRALMPTTWGGNTWGFSAKDYTTKHLTIYNDDARAVLSVVNDSSQQPNVIYATCVTPEGVRVANMKYPGVFRGAPPAYPISGGAPFGTGTTNAGTIDGGGISTLLVKLQQMGYVDFDVPDTGTYTADIEDGVKELQRAVHMTTINGIMSTTAWDRLFDVTYTGYSLNGAHKAPVAYDPRVEKYLYTSNGSVAGLNPDYDPRIPRVEIMIDYGPGITKAAMIRHARGTLARSMAGKNWAGTIRLNANGAFVGEHNGLQATIDALTSADLMPYRDIRPGMNAWLPLFDGGTLFHISGAEPDADGVTLTVDTQARDLMTLREVLDRNRESQRDPRREWNAANRPSKAAGNQPTRDEDFGMLPQNVQLTGNTWNKVDVVVGQQGTVSLTDIRLINDKAEFAVAFMSVDWSEKRMNRRVGNPFTTTGQSWLERDSLADLFDSKKILYAVGDGKQPAGYGPNRRKRDDNGDLTGAAISGRLWDTQTWTYHCEVGTGVVISLMIYPDRDCTLKRGQILWPLLDDAV